MFRSWERLGKRMKDLDLGRWVRILQRMRYAGWLWEPIQKHPSQGRLGSTDLKVECGIMGVNSKFNIVQCSKEPFSL